MCVRNMAAMTMIIHISYIVEHSVHRLDTDRVARMGFITSVVGVDFDPFGGRRVRDGHFHARTQGVVDCVVRTVVRVVAAAVLVIVGAHPLLLYVHTTLALSYKTVHPV